MRTDECTFVRRMVAVNATHLTTGSSLLFFKKSFQAV